MRFFGKKKEGPKDDPCDSSGVDVFVNLPTKTAIQGNIQTQRSLRVECDLKGDVTTAARLVVAKGAQVEGNIKCTSALIAGYVRGNIVAMESLTLKVPAHIKGNILTRNIYIEPGVVMDGVYKIIKGNDKETE